MAEEVKRYSPSGERVLRVATEAFYREGIRSTSVDTVVARSGVSKPTLYVQFGSKRELVAAVLRRRHEQRREALAEFLRKQPGTPVERLLAVFDWLARTHAKKGFRGCPFTNAAVELPEPDHPARAVISEYKRSLRQTFTELAREAGRPDAEELGLALLLLVDGANARMVVDSDRTAIRAAKKIAARLLGAGT
ncbi:MAG: TetR/AcrR family transcriptional regulator [Pseudonocardia sp.]|nr:TetR/AcrR family transcriptional regulator [Pseudonocardia sp.]MBO0873497.1 TetR/AcrR family transcriptional regulator [Pseudonocardia sp.]